MLQYNEQEHLMSYMVNERQIRKRYVYQLLQYSFVDYFGLHLPGIQVSSTSYRMILFTKRHRNTA